jgi:hypothetical protein
MAAGFRAVENTRQLRAANSIASARPIPVEHPLISTTGASVFMANLHILYNITL